MVKRDTATLKANAAGLLDDAASAASIQPSEHRGLYDDLVDSRGVDVDITGATITVTEPDGTVTTLTVALPSRPSDAQYHATITATSTAPNEAALTTGPNHRDSSDGAIAGWTSQTTNAYLWVWSSHTLSDLRNGDGSRNQFSELNAPTRLTVGSVNGYLYRSRTILYPVALNLNWRVA